MGKRLYGSLDNRLEENKMYCDVIEVGTKCTEYMWSDRHAYEVIEVKSQTDVTIRKLVAKRTDNNGMSECQTYKYISDVNNHYKRLQNFKGKWYVVNTYSKDSWVNNAIKHPIGKDFQVSYNYYKAMSGLTPKQIERVESGKEITKRVEKINISFGVCEEYFDYSF